MSILLEQPAQSRPPRGRLIVIGAGEVGQKAAELAVDVDFEVWVVDDRPDYCRRDRFLTATKLIVDRLDVALPRLAIDSDTYCIIVTRHFEQDKLALNALVESSAKYIGMIGNRHKVEQIVDELMSQGISREALSRVHAPVGINIGSKTVNEIAISIVAELIACRNIGTFS